MRSLCSEWLKTKRTPVRWATLFVPLCTTVLAVGYLALMKTPHDPQVTFYEVLFKVWAVFVLPVFTSLLAGHSVHQEDLAGNFNGLRSAKGSRFQAYLAKLGCLALLVLLSSLLLLLSAALVLGLVYRATMAWPIWIASTLAVSLAGIALLAISLWVGFRWGMGASQGLGCIGVVFAMLVPSLGANSLALMIPWGWPQNLASSAGAYMSFAPSMVAPPEAIASGEAIGQLLQTTAAAAGGLILCSLGGSLWFTRWEGGKHHE